MTIFAEILNCFYRDKELESLEEMIPKEEKKHLNELTITTIKRGVLLLLIINLCFISFHMMKENPTQRDIDMFIGDLVFTIGSSIAYIILIWYPDYSKFYLFLSCPLGFVMLATFFMTDFEGHYNCYVACYYCYCFFCVVVVPSKVDLNNLVFLLGILLYTYRAYTKLKNGIGTEMALSSLIAFSYFYLANNALHSRLKHLYTLLLKNEKLVKEKRRVVEVFPHSVLIIPQKGPMNNCYCNNEFKSKIAQLDGHIKELEKVKISLKKGVDKPQHDENINLYEYLLRRQQNFSKNKRRANKKYSNELSLSFKVPGQQRDSVSDHEDKGMHDSPKNFSIKSLQIEWKGQPCYMHVFIDTTDIIKLEEAKNRIKLQRIMFASASHEFRTPLNAIINSFNFISQNFEDLLESLNSDLDPTTLAKEEYLSNIETITRFMKTGTTSSTLLLALVEDILNLSKIDNGTFTIYQDYFSVPELMQEVHSLFVIQCINKDIELTIDYDKRLGVCEVRSDRNRIRQILLNLVSNALKFTFEGFIAINAALVVSNDGSTILEFRVKDTGIGIKEEDQPKLFELFGMIEDNSNLNTNGCGLGLTVCKKYVEVLGGDIKVKSIYGIGTEMIFTVIPIDYKNARFYKAKATPRYCKEPAKSIASIITSNSLEEYTGGRNGIPTKQNFTFDVSKISPF
ncbi:unnamed protein product [Moneuplotes crassus]|uniref:Histidine kinase domain-containing protein n=2 Tax=Euplotes crassus TaxID=5936 RepID=A0AAD1YB65_EUPCR|nr:unnamed protein product [Moneuplotes crassus]